MSLELRKCEQSCAEAKTDEQWKDKVVRRAHLPHRLPRRGSFRYDLSFTSDEDVFDLMNEVSA